MQSQGVQGIRASVGFFYITDELRINIISEAFIVCQEYCPPEGFVPTMVDPLLDHAYSEKENPFNGVNRSILPFLACGDVSGFDSDRSYPLSEEHVRLDPVQGPIDPPFASMSQMHL